MLENRGGAETAAAVAGLGLQAGRDDAHALGVHVMERARPERREAESEDSAEVAVSGGSDDILLERSSSLVHHDEDEPVLYPLFRRR